jgi:hypothetical protein
VVERRGVHGGLFVDVQRLHHVHLDLEGALPMARMSSSTFSRSLLKVPVTSRPSMSTHRALHALFVGAANGDLLDAQH